MRTFYRLWISQFVFRFTKCQSQIHVQHEQLLLHCGRRQVKSVHHKRDPTVGGMLFEHSDAARSLQGLLGPLQHLARECRLLPDNESAQMGLRHSLLGVKKLWNEFFTLMEHFLHRKFISPPIRRAPVDESAIGGNIAITQRHGRHRIHSGSTVSMGPRSIMGRKR